MPEIKIQLQKKQREFQKAVDEYPVVFYGGAKGGGKSYALRNILLILCSKYPKSKGLLVRKTYDELVSNHIEQFFRENPILFQYYNKGDKVLTLPNGSTLRFRHLGNKNDVYNYQGQEFDFIGIDEATQHEKEIFIILRSSNRTTNPNIKPKFILTGNPGGIGHSWVKKMFINGEFEAGEDPNDYHFVPARVWDNQEIINNDPDYVKRLQSLPEHLKKAYLDGEWDIFEGQFFSEWRTEYHIIEPITIDKRWKRFICGDYGYAKPSAIYWCAVDFNGRIIVYRELYKSGLTYKELGWEIAHLMAEDEEVEYAVFDPSLWGKDSATGLTGIDLIKQGVGELRRIRFIEAVNDRKYGWGVMRDYLRLRPSPYGTMEAGIVFFKTCSNAIRTIPEMIYDAIKVEDMDTDLEDHASDSIRYGLVSKIIKPSDTTTKDRQQQEREREWRLKHKIRAIKRQLNA
jgi:phage terminase large subunit